MRLLELDQAVNNILCFLFLGQTQDLSKGDNFGPPSITKYLIPGYRANHNRLSLQVKVCRSPHVAVHCSLSREAYLSIHYHPKDIFKQCGF